VHGKQLTIKRSKMAAMQNNLDPPNQGKKLIYEKK